MKIEITKLVSPKALYGRFPGQTQAQPCFVELDLEEKTLSADWDGEIGNAVPMDVYHGLRRRYAIPCLVAKEANALMEDLLPLAERVVAGAEIVWDGSNHVAELDESARDAEDEIQRLCEGVEGQKVVEWEACDFFADAEEGCLKISLDMDVAAYARELEDEWETDQEGNPLEIHNLESFLQDKLDELKEAVALAAEAGDDWMLNALGHCDQDGRSRSEWYDCDYPEFSQALSNANAPAFPTFDTPAEVDAAYDAAWNRLQREGIIAAIEDYNTGRPDHIQLHFDECKPDFIDPDVGEWKPYGAWNYQWEPVFVCATIEECQSLLREIEEE